MTGRLNNTTRYANGRHINTNTHRQSQHSSQLDDMTTPQTTNFQSVSATNHTQYNSQSGQLFSTQLRRPREEPEGIEPSPDDHQCDKRRRIDDEDREQEDTENIVENEDEVSLQDSDSDQTFRGQWFTTPARNFVRNNEMWMPSLEILEVGEQDSAQLTMQDYGPKKWYKILLHRDLVKAIPQMYERAAALKLSKKMLAKKLDKKRGDARNEDVARIKDFAQDLRPLSDAFNPPLNQHDKAKRGFHHPQLARLICPVDWLDDFDNKPSFRQKLIDGKKRPTPQDLPLLLFDEDTFDIEKLPDSFLRNNMLVHAWRMIFIGPKAALTGVPAARQSGKGNAARNGLKHMTVQCLAYIATLVYYALRSDTTFHRGGDGEQFDYGNFYEGIVTTLLVDTAPERLQELLYWWDRKVFPNYVDQEEPDDDESADSSLKNTGRGLLRDQLRREVFANSTNTL